MREVRYTPEARAEFLHDAEYYAAISTRLAELYDTALVGCSTSASFAPLVIGRINPHLSSFPGANALAPAQREDSAQLPRRSSMLLACRP